MGELVASSERGQWCSRQGDPPGIYQGSPGGSGLRFPVRVGVLPAWLAALPTGHMQCALATGDPSKGQPAGSRLGVA